MRRSIRDSISSSWEARNTGPFCFPLRVIGGIGTLRSKYIEVQESGTIWICNRSINWLESTRSPKIWLSSRNLSQASWSYIRQYCCPGNLAHVTHLHFPVITSSSCRICGEALPNQNETGCDRCFQYASVSYRPKHFCVMLFQYISPILSSAD